MDRRAQDGDGWICEPLRDASRVALMHPTLRELYAYWDGLRGQRSMPERREIDPAAIPSLLPQIGIFELIDSGRAFKIRLLGSKVTREAGRDLTGQVIDATSPNLVALRLLYIINLVVLDRVPFRTAIPSTNIPGKDHYAGESLSLPLSAGAHDVAFVLGAQVLTPRAGA